MGSSKGGEMLFWTRDEYLRFSDAVADKPESYYSFEILYWCGLRVGELLALTPADFDWARAEVKVTKSYQRLSGRDVVTPPQDPQVGPRRGHARVPGRGAQAVGRIARHRSRLEDLHVHEGEATPRARPRVR